MIEVGTKKKLNVDCLRNSKGTIGVCYEVYNLGDHIGYSFIFVNGEYDGFGEDELEFFDTEYQEFEQASSDYIFTNVIKLSQDYRDGVFDKALEI